MNNFYPLSVSDIRPTGNKAVCITFDVPSDLKEVFSFLPGQYITLKMEFQGKEVRRAYSICSSPGSGALSIGVKAVKDGLFSAYANSRLGVGDKLEVMPPQGRFILNTNPGASGNYIAFAAGSGITPVLSIIKAVMEEEPGSTFSLVFGNRTSEEKMFSDEINALESLYPDRFFVADIYSKTRVEAALFGRIDRGNVNFLLKNRLSRKRYDKYFLCGPESMIDTVKELLLEKGVDKDAVLFELFTSEIDQQTAVSGTGNVMVSITLDDETETFSMSRDQSILQAALDHGMEAPYSCQGGICSTCIARLTAGKAEMRKNQILTDSELEEGFILTCQAHPTTDEIAIDYDDI